MSLSSWFKIMLIKRPRSFPIRIARELFFKLTLPVRQFYWWLFQPERPGVKTFIFNSSGELLLVRLGYGKKRFTLPGGGINRHESAEVAATREIFEETGVRVNSLTFLESRTYTTEHKKVTVSYFFAYTETIDIVIDNQEIIDAGWFMRDALPDFASPLLHEELLMLDVYIKRGAR